MLRQDLPVTCFTDRDFLVLNGRVALHYGIDGVEGEEFRRVTWVFDTLWNRPVPAPLPNTGDLPIILDLANGR